MSFVGANFTVTMEFKQKIAINFFAGVLIEVIFDLSTQDKMAVKIICDKTRQTLVDRNEEYANTHDRRLQVSLYSLQQY